MKKIDYNIIPTQSYFGTGLAETYHKGQKHVWDGKEVLSDLLDAHGKSTLGTKQKNALQKILSLILWGEFTAWQVSNSLSLDLKDFDSKMAATAQAHDEARHFYVMCDYFSMVLDVEAADVYLSPTSRTGLEGVLNANTIAKKLLGMQLMVEPVAITIFKNLQENKIEPILTNLLSYYIKDEARHIALGVKQLPIEISNMSWRENLDLLFWQSKILKYEIDGLLELKDAFSELGINYIDLFEEAERRQIEAAEEMFETLRWSIPIKTIIKKITRTYLKLKK